MDSGIDVPREVPQHNNLGYNETIGVMNEKEIGTAVNHSGTRISGKRLLEI
jgi:hypothetical protein